MNKLISIIITTSLIAIVNGNARGQDTAQNGTLTINTGWPKLDTSGLSLFSVGKVNYNSVIKVDTNQTYFFSFPPKFIVIREDTVFDRDGGVNWKRRYYQELADEKKFLEHIEKRIEKIIKEDKP